MTSRVAGVAAGRRHPVGEPLRGHDAAVMAVAVGALPDGTPVIISGGRGGGYRDGTVRVWRTADGTPVGEPLTGHGAAVAVAVGALPDGTPVIVSGGQDDRVRVWRLADGTPVGEPLTGHGAAVAVGVLPDGTPVIVSGGGDEDGTVRVWRLADGTPVGEPLRGHDGPDDNRVSVAVGALPDGTPVIISGGWDRTVRMWRLADGTPVMPPLALPESVRAVTIHGIVIVTAAGADIAVHQPALPRAMR
jgi:WD40 repeat protein